MGHIRKGPGGRKPRRDAPRPDGQGGEEGEPDVLEGSIGYGHRGLAEAVFSVFKRLFGEHLMALRWENIQQEMRLKVTRYNRWRDESIAREAGGGTSWPYDGHVAAQQRIRQASWDELGNKILCGKPL